MRLRAVCSGKVFSSAVKKAWVWNGGYGYVGGLRDRVLPTYGAGIPELELLGASFVCEDENVGEFEGSRRCDDEADDELEGGKLVGGSPRVEPV